MPCLGCVAAFLYPSVNATQPRFKGKAGKEEMGHSIVAELVRAVLKIALHISYFGL